MAKKEFHPARTFFAALLALIIGFVAAFAVYTYMNFPVGGDSYASGELQFHFMELGNKFTGDSIYIKAGDTDILIDAGSRTNSTARTSEYINQFCTDNTLEYVIATHADQDHISGFAGSKSNPSMFERYVCETIIDFPLTDKTSQTYTKYVEQRDAEVAAGAVHYTALECWNETNGAKRSYEVSPGIYMDILYNYFYENRSADENNYSVCVMFRQGDRNFLLTGDLEEDGEKYLVEKNELPKVELFKAGHHGSKTSSNDCLLEIIQPKIVCVTCCAGSDEYTDNKANQFPTQAMIDRVAPYTQLVYVTTAVDSSAEGYTSMNGDIVVTSDKSGVTVNCSNNNTVLKDTQWFKDNRVCPSSWLS